MTEVELERYPAVATDEKARAWLQIQGDLGRAHNTVDAYTRGLEDYFRFSHRAGVRPERGGAHPHNAPVRDMQFVLAERPAIAHAVRCLSLLDVLELQLQLLAQPDWPEFDQPEQLPPNVIRFRPRHR